MEKANLHTKSVQHSRKWKIYFHNILLQTKYEIQKKYK